MLIYFGVRRYGRSDISTQHGICFDCRKTGHLTSYTSAKFFHLYFIPIIPLGNVRVVHSCPHCKELTEVSLRKHKKKRETTIQSVLGSLKKKPYDPEEVKKGLAGLSLNNDQEHFEQLASVYGEKMKEHPEVQLAIAEGHYRFGKFPEALAACERSLSAGEEKRAANLKNKISAMTADAARPPKRPISIPIFLPYLVTGLILLLILGDYLAQIFFND